MFPKERDPNKAMLAKVIPTPNNGFAELVALQRDQVDFLCTLFKTWSTCKFNLKPFKKKKICMKVNSNFGNLITISFTSAG